ncbi:MAG: TRAP transporter substrate-binding protein DctP [Elusimicrobia bacterium]|nr:TRAP transporter substrate-binding protein DctP [Elusimicrobiota bacterium]
MRRLPALVLAALAATQPAGAAQIKLRWLLLRDSDAAVEETAREFARRLEAETRGAMAVEIVTRAEYQKGLKPGKPFSVTAMLGDVTAGRYEVCEAPAAVLGVFARSFWALGIPYLFSSAEFGEEVAHGTIGRSILNMLSKKRGHLQGLALATAGWTVFGVREFAPLDPNGFRGFRIQVWTSYLSQTVVRKLGGESVVAPPDAFLPLAERGLVDAVETTLPQFQQHGMSRAAREIVNSRHVLLFNAIIVNGKTFDALPEDRQETLRRVAEECAKGESRRRRIAEADARKAIEAEGVKVIDLNAEQMTHYHETMSSVMGSAGALLGIEGSDQVEAIRGAAVQHKPR